jgi:hypothetical protein
MHSTATAALLVLIGGFVFRAVIVLSSSTIRAI